MRGRPSFRTLLPLIAIVSIAPIARAQTIRGSIVAEGTGQPVGAVLVTLVGSDGADIPPGVRTDSLGVFRINAARPGRYSVRAVRIGFRPQTSEVMSLGPGELVVVRLRMTTVAQQLVPVRIVERRPLNLGELMSTAGFDLRMSKGVGRFLDSVQLSGHKLDPTTEVLRRFRPALEFTDGPDGTYITMPGGGLDVRTGLPTQCTPEVYLDGHLLSSPMSQGAGHREHAFALLEGNTAADLYGVEVYKGGELPPPSLGGLMGDNQLPTGRKCGVIAVWTKKGRALSGTAPKGVGLSGIQVVRGTLVDFDSDRPVVGVRVTLVSEAGTRLSEDVETDSLGEFVIRTRRIGKLKLEAGDMGRGPKTTPVFDVAAEELVLVRFFVSAKTPVMAPLAVRARALPGSRPITDVASFAYRRERGLGGSFFIAEDISRSGSTRLAELIRGVDGIVVRGTPPSDTIVMRNTVLRGGPFCPPAVFMNGTRAVVAPDSLSRISMDRIFGVEVYTLPSLVPPAHAHEIDDCGMIGIWTKVK